MQIAVITGPTPEIALPRIRLANNLTDGIELRLDLFEKVNLDEISTMKTTSEGKVIFTLRTIRQGGRYKETENQRFQLIEQLFALEPDYIDLEYDTSPVFIERIQFKYPNSKIILSYHNFERTPRDLDSFLINLQSKFAYAYKICTTANYLSDAYRMLRFIQKATENNIKIIGLCMGEHGHITREEGLKSGNYLNYKILHKQDNCARGLHFA